MDTLGEAREGPSRICGEQDLDGRLTLTVAPLSAEQAIGERASEEFVLKKGKEQVIEASYAAVAGAVWVDSRVLSMAVLRVPSRP